LVFLKARFIPPALCSVNRASSLEAGDTYAAIAETYRSHLKPRE
jgi:hypothetical protein